MYGFPDSLDYARIVGHSTTQLCIGPSDLQFTLGDFRFMVQSPITLLKDGAVLGAWDVVSWPDAAFYEVMNVVAVSVELPDVRTMRISFENGMTMVLCDDSDVYESLQIIVGEAPSGFYVV